MKQGTIECRPHEYFVHKHLMAWFDDPRLPAPPLYRRLAGSTQKPTCPSPIGQLEEEPSQLQRLTADQVAVWFAT